MIISLLWTLVSSVVAVRASPVTAAQSWQDVNPYLQPYHVYSFGDSNEWQIASEYTGAGNWEQQAYLPGNVGVSDDGGLEISVKYDPTQNYTVAPQPSTSYMSYKTSYTSGKIQAVEFGINTGAVVFRGVRVPTTDNGTLVPGAWPALWLLPLFRRQDVNQTVHPGSMSLIPDRLFSMPCWPHQPTTGEIAWCTGGGEIDVMELGYKDMPNVVMQTVHTGDCSGPLGTCADPFAVHLYESIHTPNVDLTVPHDYAVAWDATGLLYFIDGNVTGRVLANSTTLAGKRIPFLHPEDGHVYSPVIDVAVGGNTFAPLQCDPSTAPNHPDYCTPERIAEVQKDPYSMKVGSVEMFVWKQTTLPPAPPNIPADIPAGVTTNPYVCPDGTSWGSGDQIGLCCDSFSSCRLPALIL